MKETLAGWRPRLRVEKYRVLPSGALPSKPYEVVESIGNILTFGGASAFWQKLIRGGGTTVNWDGHFGAADANSHGAYIAVGNDNTAATATDVDLGAAGTVNAYYAKMDTGYPQYQDGSTIAAGDNITNPNAGMAIVDFKATFGTSVANFSWNEWALGAIGSPTPAGSGDGTSRSFTATGGVFANRILNHKVESIGTKTSADSWIVTVTLEFVP